MNKSADRPTAPMRLVVLISGSGSNLQAIIDAIRGGTLHAELCSVISNQADAQGLARAKQAGVATRVIDHRDYADRESFDQALMQAIDASEPDAVALAGFMRILTAGFIAHYRGRLFNIHPSLLPALRGLNTHARALAEGLREHGASVHFVTEELDGGPVIVQARVPVLPDDDAERLAARVLGEEHRIYPLALNWFATGRLRMQGHHAVFDGTPLATPLMLEPAREVV